MNASLKSVLSLILFVLYCENQQNTKLIKLVNQGMCCVFNEICLVQILSEN